MKNFKFKVLGKDTEKKSTIYISVRFGRNEKLMYSTPLRIEPKFWSEEAGRVKNTRLCINREGLNYALMSIENKMNDLLSLSFINGESLTKESVKRALDTYFVKSNPYTGHNEGNDFTKVNDHNDSEITTAFTGTKKKEKVDFHSFFEYHIQQCATRMNNRRGGQLLCHKTQQKFACTYYHIKEYERQAGIHVDFDDITPTFADGFIVYLQRLNQATNTIGTKIKCIKAVMRSAYQQGYTTNTRYMFIQGQSEDSDNVALSEAELQQIVDLDLTRNTRLEKTRDIFLVGCWTGLRFGDIGRLRKEHIGDDGIITITQSKTDDNVCIPLHPLVKEILEKYDYKLPEISNQKFNCFVKEVCMLAGIDKPFIKSITRGGRRETTVYPKWRLVSSHTARRSFATNLYLGGFPSISIMSITGHRSEAAFLKYIKVSKAEHARKLLDYWNKKR